jgi:hypothetical protein
MKKLITILIICSMLLLVSCGSESKSSNSESAPSDKKTATSDIAESSSKEEKKEEKNEEIKTSVTVRCYEVPATESKAFSGKVEKAEQIKADPEDSAGIVTILKGIGDWENNALINRLLVWIDAELSIEGDDASYYIAFEDGTLFRKNNEGLFISKGDGKLTEIMDKLCAGRCKDIERDADGLVTEEGAKKLAFLCFLEYYADAYREYYGYEKDDTADEYEFRIEKDAVNKRMTVIFRKYNTEYNTKPKEAVFTVDCEKCCIVLGGLRDPENA